MNHPRHLLIVFAALATWLPAQAQTGASADRPPAQPLDLLTLAESAVVLSASANATEAVALIDGSGRTAWKNAGKRDPLPYRFVFELRAPTVVERIGIAGAGARPGGVAGGSARGIAIEASATGPDKGFMPLGQLEARAEGETLLAVADGAPVRWLRFTVASNHGSPIWTYWNEAVVHGRQAALTEPRNFTGVYQTGRNDHVELKQQGSALTGCYSEQSGHTTGTMTGSVDNGVARMTWTSDKGIVGSALFALDSTGRLSGVRTRDRSRAVWGGGRVSGVTTPCSSAKPPANPVADSLARGGRARLYGILFDFDKATLRPDSRPAQEQLLNALRGDAGLSLVIEGHTDSAGDDAHNLGLSRARAAAVVAWLVENGIDTARLTPDGKGESAPVASNDTADGRALNRRVEAVRR